MRTSFSLLALAILSQALQPAPASAEDDDLLRLPGQGEVRDEADRGRLQTDRLKPGGGLFVSFDVDEDGRIGADELSAGIETAFADADADQNGELTALEQQDWAASLPTRDDTLANPARFDPNLDRIVSFEEFAAVIRDLAADYADGDSGEILVADLKAPEEKTRERAFNLFDGDVEGRGGMTRRN